ncbi:hypothetical protein [Nocardia caishijiensis]|uniref:Secreted protein n=1 Tax=Nocardia caishijiensis TaxID=184756 RepID=A0ABQ6YL73_9NOCA|nr:hypothetical protein [Nocardia caishijiensis]KAF0846523.1 hypothetical protein FNL39_105439 [Nocardia caishijiensis]
MNKTLAVVAAAVVCALSGAGHANADEYGPYAEYEECVQAADDYDQQWRQQRPDEIEGGGSGGEDPDYGGNREMNDDGYVGLDPHSDENASDSFARCYADPDGYWYFAT